MIHLDFNSNKIVRHLYKKLLISYSGSVVRQEHTQGCKKEAEDDTRRRSKGDDLSEPTAHHSPERTHGAPSPDLSSAGRCMRSLSAQQPHTQLDSPVSDDSDKDLDIEDETELPPIP